MSTQFDRQLDPLLLVINLKKCFVQKTVINNTNFEEKPENLPKIVENVELEKDDHQDEITVNEVTVEMDASDNGEFKI